MDILSQFPSLRELRISEAIRLTQLGKGVVVFGVNKRLYSVNESDLLGKLGGGRSSQLEILVKALRTDERQLHLFQK